ncbi:MAG: flagellar basal body L-ring protein, partial [Halothiobacillaceae bacterium]
DEKAFAPTMPLTSDPVAQRNGSLFQENIAVVLFEDTKARRVGDIITIVLTEQTNASKKATTKTAKKSDFSAENPLILGNELSLKAPGNPDMRLGLGMSSGSNQSFDGKGDSSLSNTLTGRITVTVAEVLSNGYLLVKGEKRLTINQGDEYVQVSGYVRPMDIQPDNTVLSTHVADARISYTGDGAIGDATNMGFLTNLFNKWWPF